MHSEKPRKKKIHKHENTYTGDILKRQEAIIMMTEDRYTAILDALKERKSMTVAEFTEITGASESTIRRDLIALDDMGKIKRFHGGAKAIEHEYITNEAPVSAKAQLNVEEKSAIAKYAATMINDEDFIFIDAGTSTELMIDYIGETNATFVTNGIAHAKRLLKSGSPTGSPEAAPCTNGAVAISLSITGVFASATALPSVLSLRPYPSRTIKTTGFLLIIFLLFIYSG